MLGLARRVPREPEVVAEIWGIPVAPGLPADDPRAIEARNAPPVERAAPAAVTGSTGGIPFIVLGAVLAVGALVAGTASAIGSTDPNPRPTTSATPTATVAPGGRQLLKPDTLLGESANPVAADSLRSGLLAGLPSGLSTADVLAYGTPPKTFVVVGLGTLASSDEVLSSFKSQLAPAVSLESARTIDAGPLGGDATCFTGRLVAAGQDAQVCTFIDGTSLVATIDLAATAGDGDDRARQIRAAVLSS